MHTQDQLSETPRSVRFPIRLMPILNRQPSSHTRAEWVPSRAFATSDILWSLGIWSVILLLSPVIVVYMLMVE